MNEDDPHDSGPTTPHDALFKLTFEQPAYATDLLRALLPEAALASIDFSTLQVISGSVVDHQLRYAEVDLLYQVQIAGRDSYVFVLLEHQSTVDPMMPLRLLRYMGRIYDRYVRQNKNVTQLPAILPLVLAHAERPWSAATSFGELIDLPAAAKSALAPYLVDFRFLLEDLTRTHVDELRKRESLAAMARVVLFLLKRARTSADLLGELRSWRDLLRPLVHGAQGDEHTTTLVVYMRVFAGVAESELRAFLRDELHTDPDQAMTAAEKLLAQFGRAKWLQEGRIEERVTMTLRVLMRRFGPLDAATEARVRSAEAQDLEAIIDRALTVDSLAQALDP